MNVKKLLIMFFLVTALISMMTGNVHAATQVFVDQDPPIGDPNIMDTSLQSGSKFNITVNVADVADLYSYEFKLNWTGSMLNVTNVYPGPFLPSGGSTMFLPQLNNTAHFVYVVASLFLVPTGVYGSGILAYVEFLVEDYGSTDLQLYDPILVDSLMQSISHSSASGYFRNKYPGDVNGDYLVGVADFSTLAGAYGSSSGQPAYDREADFNLDGLVGVADFSTLAGNYGKTFP